MPRSPWRICSAPWHSFMMVKLEYWAFPVALAAGVFAVLQLIEMMS